LYCSKLSVFLRILDVKFCMFSSSSCTVISYQNIFSNIITFIFDQLVVTMNSSAATVHAFVPISNVIVNTIVPTVLMKEIVQDRVKTNEDVAVENSNAQLANASVKAENVTVMLIAVMVVTKTIVVSQKHRNL
jgi:hypothetical protein